jgi:LPS-assembly protein
VSWTEAVFGVLVILQQVYGPPEPGPMYGPPAPPTQEQERPGARRQQPFELRSAERFSRVGDRVEAKGTVVFSFRGFDVTCDEASGDLATEIFTLRGGVLVVGPDQVVRGEVVTVDFQREAFTFENGSAGLKPRLIGGNLRDDLFVDGAAGGGDREQVVCEDCGVTTCDRGQPHFEIRARQTDVIPGRRAILRDAELRVFDRRILRVPFLVLPLQRDPERYIPEFGQSRDEGYYVKSRFTTPLGGEDFWDSRVDYFTKLGAGLGGDYSYAAAGLAGVLKLYTLTGGPRSLTGSWNHRQKAFGGSVDVDSSYQRANYLTAPGATLWNVRSRFDLPQSGGARSGVSYFRTSNQSGGFASVSQAYGLTDSRLIGSAQSDLGLTLSENASRFGDRDPVKRSLLDVRWRGAQDLPWASLGLDYQRSIPVGTAENFFSGSDRTPLFSLRSDGRRLLGSEKGRRWPFRTELSVGELVDPRERRRITRTSFDWSLNASASRGRSAFDYGGRFRQGLYSDATAQYVLGTDLGVRYDLWKDSSLSLRYSYLRPYGFTPLVTDQSGRTNLLSGSLSLRPLRTLQLSAETAFDVLRLEERGSPWQTLNLRSLWAPNDRFRLQATAGYDSPRQVWSNVRFDLGWRVAGGLLSAGARFDGERHTWGAVNLYAEGLRWGRLTAGVLLNYNGYRRGFEARHFSFVYDLHCVDAILQIIDNPVGFRSGREIAFFIRLKALPFATPFGSGRRGQAVGFGSGGLGF